MRIRSNRRQMNIEGFVLVEKVRSILVECE